MCTLWVMDREEIEICAAACQEGKVWLMGKYFIIQM